MDVLEHLMEEHRKVESLLEELGSTEPGAERDRLVDEVSQALAVHMAVEEQYLYPIVVQVAGQEPETEAEVEHDLAREGIAKLKELRKEPGFGAAVDMVKAGIAHHVKEEEHEIFPTLRKKAGDQIAGLDPEKLEVSVEALDASRDELYERARQADIPGRSSMTKEQLAEALAAKAGS